MPGVMLAAAMLLLAANSGATLPPPGDAEATPAPTAVAEAAQPGNVSTASPPPAPAAAPVEKKAKPPLEITGRVYARESFGPVGVQPAPDAPWAGRFSLESARVGAKYRGEDFYLEIEAELEGRPELKDAYVKLDTGYGTALRAGQFKAPFSALALESSWSLPTVGRGRLDELLIDTLQIGGRRPGAQIEWSTKSHALRPKVEAGIWQGTDQEGEPRADGTAEVMGETAGARASVRPGPVEIGVSGAWRAAQPIFGKEWERFWAAGTDVVIVTESRFRSWVEGGAGSSWADEDPADGKHAVFGYARAVAAWRLGGAEKGEVYLEPFAAGGAIDPGLEVQDDVVWESAFGVNAGRWKRWRAQLQYETSRASRNTPESLHGPAPDVMKAVLLQVGFHL